MTRLKEIHDYLKSKGYDDDALKYYDSHSVYLAMEIMEYAHRDTYRVNGDEYATHPSQVMQLYRNAVGITPDDPFCIDVNLLYSCNVPFDGVQEVALLHDVVEDTDFSHQDIKDIFIECDLEQYFNLYIDEPLKNITHDKSEDYGPYIKKCLSNPISALVKMCDMQNNINTFTLDKLANKEYERILRYIGYIKEINDEYQFIENIHRYNVMFNK